mgnify:FL=1|tara:strand:+ start:164 stop:631 length:468 start_codon:yes stop_codon:yes gene_type:complete
MRQSLKKLTPEEAKNYIPLTEDFTNQEPHYFTIIPGPDGWSNVTYYTNRRIDQYKNKGEGDSWVYVLSNASMPGALKIGYTRNHPIDRAKQLSSSTGVASPFVVEHAFQCFSAEGLECELHKFFEEYRVSNNREFFRVSLEEAKKAIENLGQRYL